MKKLKKNDALMRAALKKMGIGFRRNKQTFEPEVFIGTSPANAVWCYCNNGHGEDYDVAVPSTPEDLGRIVMFDTVRLDKYVKVIHNVFYGVKSYEELQMKLDLMA